MNLVKLDIDHILEDIYDNPLCKVQFNLKYMHILLGCSLGNRKARKRMERAVITLDAIPIVLTIAAHFQCVISDLDHGTLYVTVVKSDGRSDVDIQRHAMFKVGGRDHF